MADQKDKRGGMPAGIFRPTMPPPETEAEGQGGGPRVEAEDDDAPAPKPRARKRRADKPPAGADRDGFKLYLSEDVRFRLRMLAFKRGAKLSTVANDVLDKALPRWNVERAD